MDVLISQSFDPIIKEAEQGAIVDLNSLPPPLPDKILNPITQSTVSPHPLKRQESERQKSTPAVPVADEIQKSEEIPQPAIPGKMRYF